VDYTNSATASHPTRWKRKRRDETAFINIDRKGHQYLGTTSRITGDAKGQLAFVRSRAAGLELAKPKPKKPKQRNPEYYAATLRLCVDRGVVTPRQFEILVNDIPELGAVARAAIAENFTFGEACQ
jgi:hypothetical protein